MQSPVAIKIVRYESVIGVNRLLCSGVSFTMSFHALW
jgi:hypothetical protein